MLTYDAMAIISERIAARLAAKMCPEDNNNAEGKKCLDNGNAPKGESVSCACKTNRQLLIQDSSTLTLQTAASSFTITSDHLAKAYTEVCVSPAPFSPALAPLPTGLAGSDIANLLGAIKSSATVTNQTFQPTSASLVNLFTASLTNRKIIPHSSANPGNLGDATVEVSKALASIDKARTDCRAIIAQQSKADPDPGGKLPAAERDKLIKARDAKAAADQDQLKALDTEYAAFRTLLMSQTADGTMMATVIKGTALKRALAGSYWIFAPSFDGGGGDTRTRHWFLIDLIYPTWDVSYNGGAIISYTLTDSSGNPTDAAMYRYMKDWTRWGTEFWHTGSPGKLMPHSAKPAP